MGKEHRVQTQINILKDLGYEIGSKTTILDLGCGNGDVVMEFRKKGFQAFGCDFVFKEGKNVQDLENNGFIKRICDVPYQLPFPDNTFDIVLSDQVLEHVKDYPATLGEISRIMKADGVGLHFFPSRYTPIEPHVYVPLATVIQRNWWLRLWALLGVRTKQQQGMPSEEVARQNFNYLRDCTNYLTKKDLVETLLSKSRRVIFCEDVFFKYSRRAKLLYFLSKIFKFVPGIYSTFRMRILLTVNK